MRVWYCCPSCLFESCVFESCGGLSFSSSYLEPVQTNWLLRVVTTVTVYERPDENWYVAPVQLEPHAVLIAMLTETNPLGLTEAGYFPALSVGQLSRAYWLPLESLT